MGWHRDLKINYDDLSGIKGTVNSYIEALTELQTATNNFVKVIKAQEGDTFSELNKEFEDSITVNYKELLDVLKKVYNNMDSYMEDMQEYISPENSAVTCRVDRNDICWNKMQIAGIPSGYIDEYPCAPSHFYFDEFVNPFADDADEVRARNEANKRKRERNYNKLANFYNETFNPTTTKLYEDISGINDIYTKYVVEYENTDDAYAKKMDNIYSSIKDWKDILEDIGEGAWDFLRGFGTGIVDLVKGLKAPLEIAIALSPTALPPGVRLALLYDGGKDLYRFGSALVKDPENTIGAMFQGMADTADEEGAAFTVGYSVEKVVEIVLAKKLAEKVSGPKVDGKTPFRDMMTPEEAAKYDSYWSKVAEKKMVSAAENKAKEILMTQSNRDRGPCLSTIYDPELDKIYYGQNFRKGNQGLLQYQSWINNEADPFIRKRYLPYKADVDSGRIVLEQYVDKRLAAHSEIRALDQAIKARRQAGLPINLDDLYVYNIDLNVAHKYNILLPKCRCPNCKVLTDGIKTIIHD